MVLSQFGSWFVPRPSPQAAVEDAQMAQPQPQPQEQ